MTPNEAKVLIVQVLLLPLYARVCLGTVAYELVMRGYEGYERTRCFFRNTMYRKTS
jgi:hypothetical protein